MSKGLFAVIVAILLTFAGINITHPYAVGQLYIPDHLASDRCSIEIGMSYYSGGDNRIRLFNRQGNGVEVVWQNAWSVWFSSGNSGVKFDKKSGKDYYESIKLEIDGDKFSAWLDGEAVYINQDCYPLPNTYQPFINILPISGVNLSSGFFKSLVYKEW